MSYFDLVGVITATVGTGPVNVAAGGAVAGHRTFVAAGVPAGWTGRILIEDGANKEVSRGTFDGTNINRTLESSSTGSLLSLSGAASVKITLASADLNQQDADRWFFRQMGR